MRWPSSSTTTRSPSSPRMTGRAGAAPKARVAMPGSDCSVAPIVLSSCLDNSCPVSTEVG